MDHGVAPPTAARIALTSTTPPEFVLDAYGNVTGGLRSPFVDMPIYTFVPADTTAASSGPLGFLYCTLFGYKVPLSEAQLIALYASHEQYVQEVAEEAEQMRQERFLLDHSARAITRQAENADVP